MLKYAYVCIHPDYREQRGRKVCRQFLYKKEASDLKLDVNSILKKKTKWIIHSLAGKPHKLTTRASADDYVENKNKIPATLEENNQVCKQRD